MKKSTPAANPSGKRQNPKQEMHGAVVTRLQTNSTRNPQTVTARLEPDIDLKELRTAIDELPELNATKVVALHRRIVNGDYKIDSERLAQSIVDLESSLDRD